MSRRLTLQRDGRDLRDSMIYGAGPSGDERRRWKRKEEKRKENRCGCEGKSCEAENASLHAGHPNKTRDSSSSIGNYTREVLLVSEAEVRKFSIFLINNNHQICSDSFNGAQSINK